MVSRTISVEAASVLVGVSRASAYEAVRSGSLPSLRIGRRVVVPLGQLAALLGETPESLASALEDADPNDLVAQQPHAQLA